MNDREKRKVLVVDDEPHVRESLKLILGRFYAVDTAAGGDEALEKLETLAVASTPEESTLLPELLLVDVMMPGVDGMSLLRTVRETYPQIAVIMLTASKGIRTAVEAMKLGAVDYLNKPYDVDELLTLVDSVLSKSETGADVSPTFRVNHLPREGLQELQGDFGAIVGTHPRMEELYKKIQLVASRDTTVLITGESGTGKELVAREVHDRSPRADKPFVALNCAAIPETLIESELFGHEKGSFTHAVDRRLGHFELADGGTLFLDEIGELSLAVQVKILRFLQEQEFYRIGRSRPLRVDVRIITATNKNLEVLIREGKFREDLFYRINVVNLELPALRERREDIPQLTEFFIKRLGPLYGSRDRSLAEDTYSVFSDYDWPGNVRELENVTESLLALTSKDVIGPEELPLRLRRKGGLATDDNEQLKTEVLEGNIGFDEANRVFETDLIVRALEKSNYVQTRAAELLGISRRILKYKMDKLGISDKKQVSRGAETTEEASAA